MALLLLSTAMSRLPISTDKHVRQSPRCDFRMTGGSDGVEYRESRETGRVRDPPRLANPR
jgi:hypothetical protein